MTSPSFQASRAHKCATLRGMGFHAYGHVASHWAKLLADVPNRKARRVCSVALLRCQPTLPKRGLFHDELNGGTGGAGHESTHATEGFVPDTNVSKQHFWTPWHRNLHHPTSQVEAAGYDIGWSRLGWPYPRTCARIPRATHRGLHDACQQNNGSHHGKNLTLWPTNLLVGGAKHAPLAANHGHVAKLGTQCLG